MNAGNGLRAGGARTPEFQKPLPCEALVSDAGSVGSLGHTPSGLSVGAKNDAAIRPSCEFVPASGSAFSAPASVAVWSSNDELVIWKVTVVCTGTVSVDGR